MKRYLLKTLVLVACWGLMIVPVGLVYFTGQDAWLWCLAVSLPCGSLLFTMANAKL